MDDYRKLRAIYIDIIKGFTVLDNFPVSFSTKNKKFFAVYIKHLNVLDISDSDYIYDIFYKKAINNKVPTREQREKFLIEEDIWSASSEEKIQDLKKVIDGLKDSYAVEHLKSKRDSLKRNIDEIETDIQKLEIEKSTLIGTTAESYATKKSNEEYIKISFFKDKEFEDPLFSKDEFDELSDNEINIVSKFYGDYTEKFNSENLKKISLSNFFLNSFYLCNDNALEFYGIPVINLSLYQGELFGYGRYFKAVLSEFGEKIPRSFMDKPDELMNWIECNKNAKKVMGDEKDTSAVAVIGATKEDLAYLGIQSTGNKKLGQALKNSGGKLNMEQMMSI